jgi:hypothetical protein
VRRRDRARQVGDEDERPAENRDQDEIGACVVPRDRAPELADPGGKLPAREIDLTDARVGGGYEMLGLRPYFWARRSKSRR